MEGVGTLYYRGDETLSLIAPAGVAAQIATFACVDVARREQGCDIGSRHGTYEGKSGGVNYSILEELFRS